MRTGGLNRQNTNREIIKILSEIRDPFYDESIDTLNNLIQQKQNLDGK